MRRTLKLLSLVAALTVSSAAVAWPDRPIRLVVPLPPGGGGDSVARLLAAHLSQRLAQPVVVENRSGAGSIIGTQAVARADNDGYTLLFATDFHAINGAFGNVPYDSVNGFSPIAQVVELQIVLLSNPKQPWTSLQQLIEASRKSPGKVTAGSPGTSSPHNLAFKLLQQLAGVTFLDVPYQGTGPVTAAFLGNQVDLMFSGIGAAKGLIEQGKARALAVTSKKRDALLPQVPTVAESGYPDYSITSWMAVLAPAGTPTPIVERLNTEIRGALEDESLRTALVTAGFTVATGSPADLKHLITTDIQKLRRIIQTAGITADTR